MRRLLLDLLWRLMGGEKSRQEHWVLRLLDFASQAFGVYLLTLFLILFLVFQGIEFPMSGYEAPLLAGGYFLYRSVSELLLKR